MSVNPLAEARSTQSRSVLFYQAPNEEGFGSLLVRRIVTVICASQWAGSLSAQVNASARFVVSWVANEVRPAQFPASGLPYPCAYEPPL